MTTRIKLRRDTAANWLQYNPILAAGEPGLETDTGKIKYGDGVTAYADLAHAGGDTLNDEGGVVVTTGSTKYWVAAQRREDQDTYGRGVRHDSQGNVYTLTQTYDDADTVSVITKYSPTGTLLWQHTIDQAQPCALAVDSGNNAYIALEGNDDHVHLIKFADDGEIVWKKEYDAGTWQGEAFIEERTSTRLVMTLNREDNVADRVLVLDIDTATGDVVTQKILTAGTNNLYASGIDTDGSGNVFVSGRYRDGDVSKDKMFVEKLNGSLDRVWSKSLETDNNYDMSGGDCASDAQGNVYAVGFYNVDTTNPDGTDDQTAGVLTKLNSSGVVQWTRRLGPGPCGQSVVGLTATDTGEVYLVSQTIEFKRDDKQLNDFEQMAESTARMILAKYDTAGAVLWQRYVDAQHVWENADEFRGQTISVFDDKFVVDFYGTSSNTIPWNFSGTDDEEADYFLVQLPADGTELTIGEVEFRESRIPGRFVEHETTESPTANEVFEDSITVTTSNLALDPTSRVANALVKSETYDYVFGPDGTLTIPNDGDIKLTQHQTGFFAVIGDTVNYDYDTQGRAIAADTDGNTYVVGEDDDTGQPIVVKISPEGYRLWSVAIEDDDTGSNGRANGVAIHPISGNVVVTCEFYGNYYYGAVVTIDQDTGRVLANNTYVDDNNDVYLNDIVFQSNGDRVVGGSKNGAFSAEQTVSAESGSTTSTLIVLRSEVDGTPTNTWQIGGTGFSQFENLQSVESYTSLTTTVREGSGAVFTVQVSSGTYSTLIVNGGTNYLAGHKIVISSSVLGGTAPFNDLTITVDAVDAGVITSVSSSGTPVSGGTTAYNLAQTTDYSAWTVNATSSIIEIFNPQGSFLALLQAGVSSGVLGEYTSGGILYRFTTTSAITFDPMAGGGSGAWTATYTPDPSNAPLSGSVSAITLDVPTNSGPWTNVTGTNYLVGSGATFNYQKDPSNSNYSSYYNFNVNSQGSNYAEGDVLTVSGDQLGGTSPANDLVFSLYTAGSGSAIAGNNLTGTAQTTTWKLMTNTAVDFGQSGSWQLTYPLSRENILIGDGWTRTYGTNTGDQTDRTYAIAVDSDDNIITATQGYGVTGEDTQSNLAVVYKFNSTGTLQWARKLNELIYGAEAKGVTTIGTDIYVTHYSYDNGDTVITKLDADGNVKWQRKVDSGSDSSISATPNGDLIVVAEAYNNDISDDAIKLFRLTSSGETVYKRWLFATTENDTRFKNGRCLAVKGDSMYITSYYYADDYDSWFVARLPVDGSGTGENNQFRYMDVNPMTGSYNYPGLDNGTNYIIEEVGSSYAGALNIEPYVNSTNLGIAGTGALYVNTYYPPYFYEDIRDQDGGNIVFADGTKQNTSATDIPQRIYTGAKYTLGLRDRGHHIYCRDENRDIIIPYDARVPFPIGTTITLVNDSGSTVYIYTEGGGTQVMLPGNGYYNGFQLDNYGVATLLKIGRERWVITGNVSND